MPHLASDSLRPQGQAGAKPPSRERKGINRVDKAGAEIGDRRNDKTLLSPMQLQDLRHNLCGHFPAFYDLPRMLSILGEEETQVKDLLAEEMKHMQAYGGQTAPAGGLGVMGRDQAMVAAMNDKNSLVHELKTEDETMIWNINYKEKYQKFSGLYDSLYDNLDDSRDGARNASTTVGEASGEGDGDSTFITAMQTTDDGAGGVSSGEPSIMDIDAALERFAGNRQHLEDMMLSLQKLCTERVLPQLDKSLVNKDRTIIREEAEFLKEAGEIIAADAMASAANRLIALVDQGGNASEEKILVVGKQCTDETKRLLSFVQTTFGLGAPGPSAGDAAGDAAADAEGTADS